MNRLIAALFKTRVIGGTSVQCAYFAESEKCRPGKLPERDEGDVDEAEELTRVVERQGDGPVAVAARALERRGVLAPGWG